jgi:hypothetical protein
VKSADVLDFVAGRCPELVRNGSVELGGFPTLAEPGSPEFLDWLARVAAYVVGRHEFKRQLRTKDRRAQRPGREDRDSRRRRLVR